MVLKVVLENMLRFEDGKTVTQDDIRAFSDWAEKGGQATRARSPTARRAC
jgi:aconitate hydratase